MELIEFENKKVRLSLLGNVRKHDTTFPTRRIVHSRCRNRGKYDFAARFCRCIGRFGRHVGLNNSETAERSYSARGRFGLV